MAEKNASREPVHTAFIKNVILSSGITIQELSKRINVTTTSIHHWFQSDDIRLSKIILVAKALGYDLQACIDKKPYQIADGKPNYFSFNEIEKMSLKRLYFLKHAIKESGMKKNDLAARLGITKEAITYWYVSDDITVRRLVACASVMDKDMYFRFVKDDSVRHTGECTGIHMEIEQIQSWVANKDDNS